MISRMYFSCTACGQEIIVRAQVGYEKNQPHTFSCPNCESPININLILDNPPHVDFEHDDSCRIIPLSENGIIVNLGVGFLIPKSKANQEFYFPAMELMHNFRGEILKKLSEGKKIPPIRDYLLEGFPGAARAWRHLEKACRFHRKGKHDLRDRNLAAFRAETGFKEDDFDSTLFDFIECFLGPSGRETTQKNSDWIKQIYKSHPDELKRFLKHYIEDLQDERLKEYIEICAEYFSAHHEYEQTILYNRHGIEIPEDSAASSANFELTKMFYGNAFELLGAHLDIIAALNNIDQGRPYDQMQKMDLKKYRSLNKANRTECLKNNPNLGSLFEEYDSTIRNASHHRWFRISDDRQVISYRSGGTGAKQSITYAEYTYRCNKLFLQILLVFSLEIILARAARNLLP
ncbi:hypothetical protein ACIGFL_24005 [Pseudomonas sp. NPDC077649]|uniref:hypothetical protein n=1 Tax=Pseudomonas sp. NPDC077649 TaxID=3364423 RepID=UPI0037C8F40B